MQEQIAKLEKTIKKQGNRISKLKKAQINMSDNEYKRLISRLQSSEFELHSIIEEQQEEINNLKKEVSELLEIISLSKEVEDEKII